MAQPQQPTQTQLGVFNKTQEDINAVARNLINGVKRMRPNDPEAAQLTVNDVLWMSVNALRDATAQANPGYIRTKPAQTTNKA